MAALLLALLFLTQPNGNRLTLAVANYVASFTAPAGVCPPGAPTVVNTMGGTFCVRESAEEVTNKLKELP